MNIAMFSDTYSPSGQRGDHDQDVLKRIFRREAITYIYLHTRLTTLEAGIQENVYRIPSLKFPWEKQHRIGLPTNFKGTNKDREESRDRHYSLAHVTNRWVSGELCSNEFAHSRSNDLSHNDGRARSLHPIHGTHSESLHQSSGQKIL